MADKALYKAKEAGKDRIARAPAPTLCGQCALKRHPGPGQ